MDDEPTFLNPSHAHDVDLDKVFQRLDRGLTVNLIMTPRDRLQWCASETIVGPDLAKTPYDEFDFLPVFEGADIVGLLDRREALSRHGDQGRQARDVMASLGESNVISAHSGVRDFIREADRAPARLVVDGTRVAGIVTVADLQKLPVRVAIFSLITHLELLLTEAITNALEPDGDPFSYLSEGRADKARRRWDDLQGEQVAIDKITSLELPDKITIISKNAPVSSGPKKIRRELKRVDRLRNQIAHSGRYVGTKREATRAIHAVQLAETWIERLGSVAAHEQSEQTG